jgi:hypothetical protein
LRRSCEKMCRPAGDELEQIQLPVHTSVETTERYVGTKAGPRARAERWDQAQGSSVAHVLNSEVRRAGLQVDLWGLISHNAVSGPRWHKSVATRLWSEPCWQRRFSRVSDI